jgi:hypothetical protein
MSSVKESRTMKILLFLSLVGSFILVGCNKKDDSKKSTFTSTGMILGSDKGACPCCGGWILKIDGDSSNYRMEEVPDDSGIELNEINLPVQFNWIVNRECGSLTYLNIQEIDVN